MTATRLRKFGLELETFHPTNDNHGRIVAAIQAMGYPASLERSHFATNYDRWQIKPDASLSQCPGPATEVVSPTYGGTEASLTAVRKVAAWLSSNGYDVDHHCGYHIHIDASDLSLHEIAAVAFRYNARREQFNAILPASRHSNRYCEMLTGESLSKVRRAVTGSVEEWDDSARFTAVNLVHAHKDRGAKRIEFRQHSGTLNGDKIVGWYKLLCDFIEETVRIVRSNGQQQTSPVVVEATAPLLDPVIVRRDRRAHANARTRSQVVGLETRMPVIDVGTDYDKFLNRLALNGVITQADARGFGWDETRLRVTAHWLRRNGAALVTTQRDGELAYVGQNGARTREEIFVNPAQIRRRVEVSAVETTRVVAPAPVAQPRPISRLSSNEALLAALADADILQNVSSETAGYYRQRREDLAGA